MIELSAEEARVVGALVEKQLTTPQQYPLTLNALLAACNQTSSRNPIVAYDERTVDSTLSALKDKRLVRFVHPSHGRSVIRYRQVLDEVLGLEDRQLALLAVLLLRGPQTVGELRARTERMAEFADIEHVEEELEALADREESLVGRLPRVPGHKEMRYCQLLGGGESVGTIRSAAVAERATPPPAGPNEARPSEPERAATPRGEPGPSLAAQVAVLRADVAALRRDLDEVRARLRA